MRYWVYLDGEVPGNYEPEELAALPGFGGSSMVCPADGGYEVRNWRRAGEFPDIVSALEAREVPGRRSADPMSASDAVRGSARPGAPQTADDILNDSSSRIFRHVSELMKELENRREERSLTQSLQRQSAELKNELMALRERNKFLQDRVEQIPGFEAAVQKLQAQGAELTAQLSEKERVIAENDRRIRALEQELQGVRLNEARACEDLKRQTGLCEELSSQLAAKEFTLAKAFGLIRRLESELADILPGSVSGSRSRAPEVPPPGPAQEKHPLPEIRVREPEGEERVDALEGASRAGEEPVGVVDSSPERPESPKVSSADELPPGPAPESGETGAGPLRVSNDEPGHAAAADDLASRLPEGEARSVPPPWQSALGRIAGHVKAVFSSRKAPDIPPPPPAP